VQSGCCPPHVCQRQKLPARPRRCKHFLPGVTPFAGLGTVWSVARSGTQADSPSARTV
jgi:hypothetical protein